MICNVYVRIHLENHKIRANWPKAMTLGSNRKTRLDASMTTFMPGLLTVSGDVLQLANDFFCLLSIALGHSHPNVIQDNHNNQVEQVVPNGRSTLCSNAMLRSIALLRR